MHAIQSKYHRDSFESKHCHGFMGLSTGTWVIHGTRAGTPERHHTGVSTQVSSWLHHLSVV